MMAHLALEVQKYPGPARTSLDIQATQNTQVRAQLVAAGFQVDVDGVSSEARGSSRTGAIAGP